jgi:hypothetical protein
MSAADAVRPGDIKTDALDTGGAFGRWERAVCTGEIETGEIEDGLEAAGVR